MKIFEKRKDGNRRRIYLFGIKVFSYHKSAPTFDFNFLLKVLYDTYNEANYAHNLLKNEKWKNAINLLRDEAEKLGFWDEDYYAKHYPDIKYYKISPWEHYVKYGWKMGLNPSVIFDGNWYGMQYPSKMNPLLHFLSNGRYNCHYAFYENRHPVDPDMLQAYLDSKPTRQSKKVVYTALIGDYDELIIHSYLNPDWDYVCFTDNQEYIKQKQVGPWQIRAIDDNLGLNSTRRNRYYKINPHIVLPEYDESIYIDSNINILTPFIFDYAKNADKNIIVPKHFKCNCIYQHFKWAREAFPEDMFYLDGLYNLIKSESFPENYGFTENNLIYRKHNIPEIIEIMNDWWYLIKWYAKRDQLSFCYVLWKHNIIPSDLYIDNLRSDNVNFAFVAHKQIFGDNNEEK